MWVGKLSSLGINRYGSFLDYFMISWKSGWVVGSWVGGTPKHRVLLSIGRHMSAQPKSEREKEAKRDEFRNRVTTIVAGPIPSCVLPPWDHARMRSPGSFDPPRDPAPLSPCPTKTVDVLEPWYALGHPHPGAPPHLGPCSPGFYFLVAGLGCAACGLGLA